MENWCKFSDLLDKTSRKRWVYLLAGTSHEAKEGRKGLMFADKINPNCKKVQ